MISEESGAETGPDTAQQQHHHRRTGGGDDNDQADEAADKGADDAQPAAVADGAGEGFTAGGKGRAGGDDGGGHRRPARGFRLRWKPTNSANTIAKLSLKANLSRIKVGLFISRTHAAGASGAQRASRCQHCDRSCRRSPRWQWCRPGTDAVGPWRPAGSSPARAAPAHPRVAVDRGQPFAVDRAAAVVHRRRHAVDGAVHDAVAAERGNFRAIALIQAVQLGFFRYAEM